MPHFVIEYSEPAAPSAGFSEVFEALCEAAVGTGVMKREDIKELESLNDQREQNKQKKNG